MRFRLYSLDIQLIIPPIHLYIYFYYYNFAAKKSDQLYIEQ